MIFPVNISKRKGMEFNLQAVVVEECRSLKIWMANSRAGLRDAKSGQATLGHRYSTAWLDLDMFDKLKFVAGFHHSSTAESPDKLMVFEK